MLITYLVGALAAAIFTPLKEKDKLTIAHKEEEFRASFLTTRIILGLCWPGVVFVVSFILFNKFFRKTGE